MGMSSVKASDKAINSMTEEGKEFTVDFLMQQLEDKKYKSLRRIELDLIVHRFLCLGFTNFIRNDYYNKD